MATRQVPRPLQVRAPVSTLLVQLAVAPQAVPLGCSWQAPVPSHWPVLPQVLAAEAAH